MNEQDLSLKVEEISRKVDAIYISTEKTRKYFLWTMIISIALFVLPLLGLLFAVPSFLSSYTGALGDTSDTSSSASMQAQLKDLMQ